MAFYYSKKHIHIYKDPNTSKWRFPTVNHYSIIMDQSNTQPMAGICIFNKDLDITCVSQIICTISCAMKIRTSKGDTTLQSSVCLDIEEPCRGISHNFIELILNTFNPR